MAVKQEKLYRTSDRQQPHHVAGAGDLLGPGGDDQDGHGLRHVPRGDRGVDPVQSLREPHPEHHPGQHPHHRSALDHRVAGHRDRPDSESLCLRHMQAAFGVRRA